MWRDQSTRFEPIDLHGSYENHPDRTAFGVTISDVIGNQWLGEPRLIASVQATDGSAVDDPATLARLARTSLDQGVRLLRLQGIDNIRAIRAATGAPTIGLIKRDYADSEVYITPTMREVDELVAEGCEIIALDGTPRKRPTDVTLPELIARIHQAGRIAMADCDSVGSAIAAVEAGADWVGTTLAGYTTESSGSPKSGPDLDLLRSIVASVRVPVIAEGRYALGWQVDAALRIGAAAVVVGGALNDPVKTTRALLPIPPAQGPVGAIDIGGTWLRYATFSPDWRLLEVERAPNPPEMAVRMAWIRERIERSGVERVGVSTGGIVDPDTGIVWTAKEYLMPNHIGIEFSESTLGVKTFAHGDGHATAWGHAQTPEFAGLRVATLALGTGVGCGLVDSGRIWCGRRGEYPRVNDLPTSHGKTYEELLGGIHLTREPSQAQIDDASRALDGAVKAIRDFYFPDVVVIAGSVGLSPWLAPRVKDNEAVVSPFGPDAGLFGAAALALYPERR